MDCSPPGVSVPGISWARILEWIALSFSRGSSQPRGQTHISCLAVRFFTTEPPGNPKLENAGLDPATLHMQSDCCAIWASSPVPSHIIQQFHCWVYIWRKHWIKSYMHSDFHGSIIYSSQDMKQFECPLLDEWIKKWHVYVYTHTHTHNRRFSAIKRMKSCLCNNIDEPKECYA